MNLFLHPEGREHSGMGAESTWQPETRVCGILLHRAYPGGTELAHTLFM